MKEFEAHAEEALQKLLGGVQILTVLGIDSSVNSDRTEFDLVVRLRAFERTYTLVCELKLSGQPRHVRNALFHIENHVLTSGDGSIPILIAPYLSPETQAMCRERRVGYMDLSGNAMITFGGVYIERHREGKPAAQKREIKSIFKPKSAQLLRLLLRNPSRPWKVVDLAEAAAVSVGHVSNVRKALVDREWATTSRDGLNLSNPNALLDAWRDVYEPPAGFRRSFYTTLHGTKLETATKDVLSQARGSHIATYACFSAARWMAPYGRTGTEFFYTDRAGRDALTTALALTVPSKGENVVITVLDDEGIFRDCIEPAPGVVCTSAIQTYLDLWVSGERGREAADQLRSKALQWSAA